MGQELPKASHDDVLAVGDLAEIALARRSANHRDDLQEVATTCERVFTRRASEIRAEAESRLSLGVPPSLRQLVGISNLEVPMNQVLGWMLNPEHRGAAARLGLQALGRLLDYPAFVDDIERASHVTVLCEATPDYGITSRLPDLLIGTENAAVLIENKVWSPESGPDQYSHYLQVVTEWAGQRESRAYLLAPSTRVTPHGWDGSLTHRQLSDALRPLVAEPALSFWDRVVYGLIVSDLDPDPRPNRAREIERLVEPSTAVSDVEVATKLSQLLRRQTIDPTNGGY
ncbi:MAG: PD-(D/E)XK nuclease family protein [Coriobacteriia bacterium]|nr:PD-(D/E)XK nuclease family protein [Coriobacteriia bacterium]